MGVYIKHLQAEKVKAIFEMLGLNIEDGDIIEVTEPHGRLIDADEMIKEIRRWEDHPVTYIRNRNKDFIYYLENSNAVIEAAVE